ncbi:DUF2599 domain-containing protein [Skermania sp. ID1734]|nr:DUF2599 domain-containing protein [Skermania sp. ID1734]
MAVGCASAPQASPPPAPTTTTTTATRPAYPTSDPYVGQPLIDHVQWTTTRQGKRLMIFPTEAGRKDQFPSAVDRAWAEVVRLAPGADTPGMFDQFRCHWNWARAVAPDKPSWNLEPWRPAVGYDATVQAFCNPGGPEE